MTFKYEHVLDANHPSWAAELRAFLDDGKQVAVIHLSAARFCHAVALAREPDFTWVVEAAGTLGFVPRDPSKRISN